jgi:protein-disulfide isomerase
MFMIKKVLYSLVILISGSMAVFYFVYIGNGQNPNTQKKDPAQSNPGSAQQNNTTDELIIGDPMAPVTLVEYADYKCSSCGKFHREAGKEIRDTYVDSGQLKIVFKPFPIYGKDSGLALYGSYCANNQAKFTQYHDTLFDYMWDNYFGSGNYNASVNEIFTKDKLTQLAGNIGMDTDKFAQCIADKDYEPQFNAALNLAADQDVQGTPTIFINDKKIVGPQPFNIYKQLVEINLR